MNNPTPQRLSEESLKEIANDIGSQPYSVVYSLLGHIAALEGEIETLNHTVCTRCADCGRPARDCICPMIKERDALKAQNRELRERQVVMPEGLHYATAGLVLRFAAALAVKLHAAEQKYGYSNGWLDCHWMEECQQHLAQHVAKGDPRDVAAYCAFMWHHGWRTSPKALANTPAEAKGGDAECDTMKVANASNAEATEPVLSNAPEDTKGAERTVKVSELRGTLEVLDHGLDAINGIATYGICDCDIVGNECEVCRCSIAAIAIKTELDRLTALIGKD